MPYDNSVGVLDGVHNLSVTELIQVTSNRQAYGRIIAHIDSLSSDLEAVLSGYLDEWIALPRSAVSIDGGMGSISGVSYSEDANRNNLRELILVIVPYYQYHDRLAANSENKNMFMIPNEG